MKNINTKELAKEIRLTVKEQYPQYKFSVTSDCRSIKIGLMKSDLFEDGEYMEVSNYGIDRFFAKTSKADEKIKLFTELNKLASKDRYILQEDADYGQIPNYYIFLRVGSDTKDHVKIA